MSDLTVGRPDAVIIPERLKRGPREFYRVESILKLAEPMLGVRWTAGERAYMRKQEGPTVGRNEPMLFITRSTVDTVCYAKNDAKKRRGERYNWVSNGVLALGYLKDPEDREIQC